VIRIAHDVEKDDKVGDEHCLVITEGGRELIGWLHPDLGTHDASSGFAKA
jgi:hypothetical protein